jgi:hypothetical protein
MPPSLPQQAVAQFIHNGVTMHTLDEQPPEFQQLNHSYLELLSKLFAAIKLSENSVKLPAGQSLYGLESSQRKLFVPRDIGLAYIRNNTRLFFYEPGELIGVEEYFSRDTIEIRSEFGVSLDEIKYEDFVAQIHSNQNLTTLWHQCLSSKFQLLTMILDSLTKEAHNFSPELRHFHTGDTIVKQGELSTEVLNLLEGHAVVFVDNIKVGEVLADEIFGALAALTDTPRTASVIATGNAIVLALPKENFVELIEKRPQTALKMVADMARTVVELNKRVVGLSYIKGLS